MGKKLVVLLLAVGFLLFLGIRPAGDRADQGGLRLERPSLVAFAVTDGQEGVNFLQQEAGIAAYVKLDQGIDLVEVRDAFKAIEALTDTYIVGEVSLADTPEEAHPHVYANNDGWIVAYYTKSEPASKIMYWALYRGGLVTTTTLAQAIRQVFSPARTEEIKYYHFQYRTANRIMLITETAEGKPDTFHLTIPKGLRLSEASWSLYSRYGGTAELWLDDVSIRRFDGRGVSYGDLTKRLVPDFPHVIKVGWDDESCAVVLIYE